jgi:hypothetical protein
MREEQNDRMSGNQVLIFAALTFSSGVLVTIGSYLRAVQKVIKKRTAGQTVALVDFSEHVVQSAGFVLLCALTVPVVSC